jgi:uncharacterized protein YecT (DUF1311 family)
MPTEDHISALENLAKLKATKAISDADFEAQKARLMGAYAAPSQSPQPPLFRRLWVVVTLTVLVIGFPVALAVLASGEVYRKVDGGWRPISRGARLTYAGFLALWLVAVLAKAIFHPGDWGTDTGTKAVQTGQASPTPAMSVSGKCQQPILAKGMAYAAARDKLLAAGYQPSRAKPEADSYCADSGHATTCRKLPEIQDCSADGYCKMAFQDRNGAKAAITTFGDGPDGQDTTVESVAYSCGGNSSTTNQASAAQAVPEADTANATQKAQGSPVADQGANKGQGEADQTADSLEGRYSPQFHQCMAGEDAANGSTSAMMACTTNELQAQDRKLNETYQRLMSSLPPDQREELRDQERIWVRQQAAQCPEGDIGTNGDLARLDHPSCLLSQTIRRTMALENLQAQSSQPQ